VAHELQDVAESRGALDEGDGGAVHAGGAEGCGLDDASAAGDGVRVLDDDAAGRGDGDGLFVSS
jgi:hypothetical protein